MGKSVKKIGYDKDASPGKARKEIGQFEKPILFPSQENLVGHKDLPQGDSHVGQSAVLLGCHGVLVAGVQMWNEALES